MNHLKLNLSCPRSLGDQLTEFLLDRLDGGFTTLNAHGHGRDFSAATLAEQVRGHVDVMLVMAIMPAADVASLLAELKSRFPSPHLVYWTEPVTDFGDFA